MFQNNKIPFWNKVEIWELNQSIIQSINKQQSNR
jgi:hypothetical protein